MVKSVFGCETFAGSVDCKLASVGILCHSNCACVKRNGGVALSTCDWSTAQTLKSFIVFDNTVSFLGCVFFCVCLAENHVVVVLAAEESAPQRKFKSDWGFIKLVEFGAVRCNGYFIGNIHDEETTTVFVHKRCFGWGPSGCVCVENLFWAVHSEGIVLKVGCGCKRSW